MLYSVISLVLGPVGASDSQKVERKCGSSQDCINGLRSHEMVKPSLVGSTLTFCGAGAVCGSDAAESVAVKSLNRFSPAIALTETV